MLLLEAVAQGGAEAVRPGERVGESEPAAVALLLAVGEREMQALEVLLAVAQALADALCSSEAVRETVLLLEAVAQSVAEAVRPGEREAQALEVCEAQALEVCEAEKRAERLPDAVAALLGVRAAGASSGTASSSSRAALGARAMFFVEGALTAEQGSQLSKAHC